MDKNVQVKKTVIKIGSLGAQTYVWSHFKEDPWQIIVEVKKSLKNETKKKVIQV